MSGPFLVISCPKCDGLGELNPNATRITRCLECRGTGGVRCSLCDEVVVEVEAETSLCIRCAERRDEALAADETPVNEGIARSDAGHDSARYDAFCESGRE